MAGHNRTVDTGRTRRSSGGKARRVREHRPAGESDGARRDKERRGARRIADDRVRKATSPTARLDAARDYLRSAAAKYHAQAELDSAVAVLLDAGDRIYTTGKRR